MPTLSTLPTYPAPTRPAQVVFALTGGTSNYVRVWATVAPDGSELDGKIKANAQNRFLVYQDDGGSKRPWSFTPDKGGKYTLVAQEYTRGTSYGGGYQNDPNGALSETKVGSETTLSLFIGQRMTSTIGTGADTATLVLWVWDATIRATTLAIHGEASPAIVQPNSSKASTAAFNASVLAALSALIDVTAMTAIGTLHDAVDNIIVTFAAHLVQPSVHAANDTNNRIEPPFVGASSPAALSKSMAEVLHRMDQHMRNDPGDGTGTGGAGYHVVSTLKRTDWANALLTSSPADIATAIVAIADAWRAYEGHRVSTTVHLIADTTNTLVALSPLLAVHSAFLSVIAAQSPAVPPQQSTGAVTLVSQAGFLEKQL